MTYYRSLLTFAAAAAAAAGAGYFFLRRPDDTYRITGRFVDGKEVDEETFYSSLAAEADAVSDAWKEAQERVRAERRGGHLDMTTGRDYDAVMRMYNRLRGAGK